MASLKMKDTEKKAQIDNSGNARSATNETAAADDGVSAKKKTVSQGRPRNYDFGCGVMRFSRSKMYHRKALYKFVGKRTPATKHPRKPAFVMKRIGGDKNGQERKVFLRKTVKYYPTMDKIKKRKHRKRVNASLHRKGNIRKSLTPGTVVNMLAGAHKGKRSIVMKEMPSGLLLVSGPFKINGCPLRRIHPRYVIGTSTKIDISNVKVPKHIGDEYFVRPKKRRPKKSADGDIFQAKKVNYKPSEQRKTDQKIVDAQVITAIKKHPDSKTMFAYLNTMFGLRSSQYPHRMRF